MARESTKLKGLNLMTNTTLVTGGAGCIGSALVEALIARGERVRVIDNLSSGKMDHLSAIAANPNFEFIHGDMLDAALVDQTVAGTGMVYHLAANPDVKFDEAHPTDKDLRQNTIATYNLLEAMRKNGVRKLAFASTSAIYGKSPMQPIPEQGVFPQPISLYGATKLACEGLISAFSNLFGMTCWSFRFANIVGPRIRARGKTVIADFIERLQENPRQLTILGDGKQMKSYLMASECVEAILFGVAHANEPLNVFNLGCEDSIDVTTIARLVCEAMRLEDVQFVYTGGEGGWPGDVPRFVLDVSAMKRLGWQARYSSRDAIEWAIRSTLEKWHTV
jgi:UDP-glucose 4-epimerase